MSSRLARIATSCKVDELFRLINPSPRVLFWHGVAPKRFGLVEQEICDIDVFKKQIEYLRRRFEIVSIEEFERRFISKSFSNKEIVLTFDDGYENNLTIVEPFLSSLGLPFTVFISTDHIENGWFYPTSVNRIITLGSDLKQLHIKSEEASYDLSTDESRFRAFKDIKKKLRTYPVDRVKLITQEMIDNLSSDEWQSLNIKFASVKPMDWDGVKTLASRGATIASHCKWHTCCHDNQLREVVKVEIKESKSVIEKRINKECNYFAYPTGYYNSYSNSLVRETYRMGFSTEHDIPVTACKDIACVPRIGVPADYDIFKLIINMNPRK